MKYYLLLPIAVIVLLTSCNETTEKGFNAQYIHNFTVDIPAGATEATFSQEELIDVLSNVDISEVQDKITRLEFREIQYKVWEFGGDQGSKVSGSIKVNANDDSNIFNFAIAEDSLVVLNLEQAHRFITVDDASKEAIATALKSDKKIKIAVDGLVTETPVHFVLQVITDVRAYAEIEL
ncbi:MAG: hypothetical protein GC193_06725 [Cryomorphaceae bacterium]|nr:hypothetical protein [Cryomorphaceae bacterium]